MEKLEDKVKIGWLDAVPVFGFVNYFARNEMDNETPVFNAARLLTYNTLLFSLYQAFTN